MNNLIKLVDDNLQTIVSNYPEFKEPMEYALFPRGKRFRPLLLLTILEDLEIDCKLGIEIACAIEMIHNYSLIHDDLPAMDNDDMRRGKPSLHIAFGEDLAILTGDALLTESFYYLANANIDNNKKIKIIVLISKLIGARGMIKGQLLDIKANNINIDNILEIHQHKTVDLIACSILSAAIIAEQEHDKWNHLAKNIGRAFQIKDDLDDADKFEVATIIRAVGTQKAQELFYEYRLKSLNMIIEMLGKKKTFALVESVL